MRFKKHPGSFNAVFFLFMHHVTAIFWDVRYMASEVIKHFTELLTRRSQTPNRRSFGDRGTPFAGRNSRRIIPGSRNFIFIFAFDIFRQSWIVLGVG